MKKLILITLLLSSLISCNKQLKEVNIEGFTQGSTYSIKYYEKDGISYQKSIDSILMSIDNSMSIYNPNSIISKINKNQDVKIDKNFEDVFKQSQYVSQITNGAFDCTVGGLVNAWGFGFKHKSQLDSNKVDSIKQYTGFSNVKIENGKIIKLNPNINLDFNAIAQGFTADVIANFLKSKGIENCMVEIGGEVMAYGNKPNGALWSIGIEKPIDDTTGQRNLKAVVKLTNRGLATSGNYRKFYIKDGIKYSHTIDPKTGYPVRHSLLSASVFADNSTLADAFATAFMVIGLEKTKLFIKTHPELNLDVYLIFSDSDGNMKTYESNNLKKIMEEL